MRQHRTRGIGWEHVHVCVDEATRLAYVEVLPTQQQHEAIAFLERAAPGLPPAASLSERKDEDHEES